MTASPDKQSGDILKVENVSKNYSGLKAVDDVSLSVKPGSITGLIGPNGSGKSTLFNMISGVLKQDSGSVFFEGNNIDALPSNKRFLAGMARTFQDPRLFFDMTVFENMLVPPTAQKGESPIFSLIQSAWRDQEIQLGTKARSVMKDLNIDSVILNGADEISGGQMKLLQLAQVLMNSPRLVLLDEPTAGVAPGLTNEIFETLNRLRVDNGITFFIIEHKLKVLFKFVDFVYVMHRGKLFASGSPEEIAANPEVGNIYL